MGHRPKNMYISEYTAVEESGTGFTTHEQQHLSSFILILERKRV